MFGPIDMKGPEQIDLQTEGRQAGAWLQWERKFIVNGHFSRDKSETDGDGCTIGKVSLNCTLLKWMNVMICRIYLNKAF